MTQLMDAMRKVSPEETQELLTSIDGIPFGTAEEKDDAMFAAVDGMLLNATRLIAFAAKTDDKLLAVVGSLVHAMVFAAKEHDLETLQAVGETLQQSLIYNLSKRQ